MAKVVVGISIIVVIAVGAWLSSRAQPAPIDSAVDGSAVVVSSPACQQASGDTVVDVLLPAGGLVRTSLAACGYQEGQTVAVQYVAGDPTRVSPAGTTSAADALAGRLLPYGIGIVALLAIGAALAVLVDSRRSRRAAGVTGHASAHHHAAEPDDAAPAEPLDEEPAISVAPAGAAGPLRPGRHVRPDADDDDIDCTAAVVQPGVAGRPAAAGPRAEPLSVSGPLAGYQPAGHVPTGLLPTGLLPTGQLPTGLLPAEATAAEHPLQAAPVARADGRHGPLTAVQVLPLGGLPWPADQWSPNTPDRKGAAHPQLSSVDLVFPFTSSLAASLHDELFTHRTVSG